MDDMPFESDATPACMPRSIKQRLDDAKNQPILEPLVGDFWFVGELHILFSDAGIGKSILAVQIADVLTKGALLFGLKGPARSMRILLLDFELSDRQVEARYRDTDSGEYHPFSDAFYCDSIDFLALERDYPGIRMDEAILHRIKSYVANTKADVLVIDNISFLSLQSPQDTQVALQLMRSLVELKKELGISILVLAHTPKIPGSRPITINDLAGSKHLANFADSVSGLGRSCQGSDAVYWKQCKASRSGEHVYDADNIILLQRARITPSFLGFVNCGSDSEYKHLRVAEPEERIRLREQAVEMHRRGMPLSEIAEKLLGDPRKKSTIHSWLRKDPQLVKDGTKRRSTFSPEEQDQVSEVSVQNGMDEMNGVNDQNDVDEMYAATQLESSL